jgi:Protein of unknown function (DUF3563)
MNARVPLYDGDAVLREALAKVAKPAPRAAERSAADTTTDILEIEHRARALRAELIAGLFSRFFRWIERALWRAQQRDVEHYLSQATDAADLERRMRTLERSTRAGVLGDSLR